MNEQFVVNSIPHSYLKDICTNILVRGKEAADSLIRSYLPESSNASVDFSFINSPKFNATAFSDKNNHFVEINIGSIYLLDIFCKRLFSSPSIIPEAKFEADSTEKYEMPFIKNIDNGLIDCKYEFELDENRFFISYVMQDFCCTFIAMHELAHIICGHTTGYKNYFNTNVVQEFFSIKEVIFRGKHLRRAWEYDADITASVLLSQYILHFLNIKKSQHLRDAFHFANNAKIVGLIISSLFAMFAYMAKVEYKQNCKSVHPHPLIRAQYVGDIILYKVFSETGIPVEDIEDLKIDYIYEACLELERMELFNLDKFDSDLEDVHERVLSLRKSAHKLRPFCEKWAWFPLNAWE